MRLQPTLVLLSAFFLQSLLFAQVTVLGKLSIGDNKQLQILTTNRGDQLHGWVNAWTADSIVFFTTSSLRVAFTITDVNSIEAVESGQVGTRGTEIFVLRTTDGKVYHGYPSKISSKVVAFDAANAGYLRLRPRNIVSMEPETVTLISTRNYVNEYKDNGKFRHLGPGKLLGLKDGYISHRFPDGEVLESPVSGLKKYRIRQQHQPNRGYGRSLMYVQTGFGMKRGEKEFRSIMFGINILSFGITDNVSLATGLIGLIPYADLKYSHSFGKYLHASAGVYGVLPFSLGVHASLSIGTPDYFLNFGYLNNIENESIYSYSDFESFNLGASMRVGRRSRCFAEYNILTSPVANDGDGYDIFWDRGFGNAFTWGYGWYNPRFRFETGITQTGPYRRYCFSSFCDTKYYHVPIPFIAMAVTFRR
jgi:hypothetical protein